jgi:hydrogenase expression/formation protein HypE
MMNSKGSEVIHLGHGAGGILTSQLIKTIFLKYFKNATLRRLEDSAELNVTKNNIAFTTDSYVIDPIFFPGGDIGSLAIYGTVNDLAMKGAIPEFISLSLIIEEGFPIENLKSILKSASQAAQRANVDVVCGDTKVVERGKADKIFITTSGIGIIKIHLGKEKIRIGDHIIVSGTIGDHGIAVMNERLQLGLQSTIRSDAAPLNVITTKLFNHTSAIHFMRDPTRGGIASVLNEIVDGTTKGIMIYERDLPIRREVRGACEILGLDPLYIANEGKFIALVGRKLSSTILKKIKSQSLGRNAKIIGEVMNEPQGVWLKTKIGGTHPLLQLEAGGLPRIC